MLAGADGRSTIWLQARPGLPEAPTRTDRRLRCPSARERKRPARLGILVSAQARGHARLAGGFGCRKEPIPPSIALRWKAGLPFKTNPFGGGEQYHQPCIPARIRNWVFLAVQDLKREELDRHPCPILHALWWGRIGENVPSRPIIFGTFSKALKNNWEQREGFYIGSPQVTGTVADHHHLEIFLKGKKLS